MTELFQEIISQPLHTLLIIGNLVLIESLLSVDNAAVLATMVMGLKPDDRKRALKYGLVGAYVFRGACLLLAAYLVQIWWLKGIGGLYLVYLCAAWMIKHLAKSKGQEHEMKEKNVLYRFIVGRLGIFWATVISVELMDLVFSLDNVFAAVAFSKNIIIVLVGVFIGILAMRFVAQGFVKLMERYPFLEGCAFTVIGILGLKLAASFYEHFYPETQLTKLLNTHAAENATSLITLAIFFIPLLTSILFNVPKKNGRE